MIRSCSRRYVAVYMGSPLKHKHLIFVTGKGGVGRSTVALALGLMAARRGKRTIVAELAGNDQLQRAFGLPGGDTFAEIELAPKLFTIAIESQNAMEEYLRLKLPGATGSALAQSKLFNAFAMATPGMRELLSIGKVWELSQPQRRTREADGYDFVVVDAPATGHGAAILRTPRTFSEIARVGPIAHQASKIAATLADPEFTGVVAVTTAEEMPVNEAFDVRDQLAADGLALDAVVLNGLLADRFSERDVDLIRRCRRAGQLDAGVGAALDAALSQHARRHTQRPQQQRVREAFAEQLMELPLLYVPRIDQAAIGTLADALEEQLA